MAELNAKEQKEKSVPHHHQYSMETMRQFITLVLSVATSLRGAGSVLKFNAEENDQEIESPSWSTGRLWLLRLGYYKLTRPKEKGNDWVWIVDHTVQWGTEKCLVVVGFRMGSWLEGSVGHEELEPILLEPVKESNGEVVYKQLEKAALKTGIPREIVGDEGSDLKAGIRRFCAEHKKTDFVYDIKHKVAVVLKRELSGEEGWKRFTEQTGKVRQEVQQTSLAALASPNQRSKARYMNVDVLVKWGQKLLTFMEEDTGSGRELFSWEKVEKHFGWIREYREALSAWGEMLGVVETVEHYVRKQGLCRQTAEKLAEQLSIPLQTARGCRIRDELLEHVWEESAKAKRGERLYGSSEVLESVFGKFKRLEQNQAKSGFTGLLLGIAAMVSQTTEQVIQKCMETVSTQKVLEWTRENLGITLNAKRRLAFNSGTKVGSNVLS